jgi:hypothetical protein
VRIAAAPEQRNPLGGSVPALSSTYSHPVPPSNSFALSSPGPNISPHGLRLLAALDRPPSLSPPFTIFQPISALSSSPRV